MGGLAQQAEGTTEAKAECSESARQVKSDGRTRVRFVKERGTEESPAVQLRMGCAEPPAPDMGSGERQDPVVCNNTLGPPSCPLTPRDQGKASGALPPLPPHKDAPFGEVKLADRVADPVTLSPVPSQKALSTVGSGPGLLLSRRLENCFSHPPGFRWAGEKPSRVLWRQLWLWDRPLRRHK